MTVVLDAYAAMAALVGEWARSEVEPLIETGVIALPLAAPRSRGYRSEDQFTPLQCLKHTLKLPSE